jgi:hypothetical protein
LEASFILKHFNFCLRDFIGPLAFLGASFLPKRFNFLFHDFIQPLLFWVLVYSKML